MRNSPAQVTKWQVASAKPKINDSNEGIFGGNESGGSYQKFWSVDKQAAW